MVMILMVILMIALMMMDQDIKKNKNKKREKKKKKIDKIKKFSRLIHSRAHKNIVTHSQTSHSQTNVSI
jgi:uncharacterized membrane protein